MQIHLSKPGGQREGPFTVEEINRDLATRKYNDSDYWAWYDGLSSWVPLHSVPGVHGSPPPLLGATELVPRVDEPAEQPTELHDSWPNSDNTDNEPQVGVPVENAGQYQPADGLVAVALEESPGDHQSAAQDHTEESFSRRQAEREQDSEPEQQEAPADYEIASETTHSDHSGETKAGEQGLSSEEEAPTAEPSQPATAVTIAEPEELAEEEEQEPELAAVSDSLSAPASARPAKVFSGLSPDALEQVFVFTSGEGPSVRQSGVIAMMMLEMIGKNPDDLRQRVPRDVFGKCNVGERIREESKVPGSAWRAMAALRPELIEQAKAGEYRTCVRTFSTETEDVVAIFLFYNKAKL
jgi:hypothetical protein